MKSPNNNHNSQPDSYYQTLRSHIKEGQLTTEKYEELASDPDPFILTEIARSPYSPSNALFTIVTTAQTVFAQSEALKNANLTTHDIEEITQRLIDTEDGYLLTLLSQHPNHSLNSFRELVEYDDFFTVETTDDSGQPLIMSEVLEAHPLFRYIAIERLIREGAGIVEDLSALPTDYILSIYKTL